MKAVLALIVIYVGTFFVAIQSGSQTQVQAAQQANAAVASTGAAQKQIDPVKEADIRSLMELIGARDIVQDSANNAIEQYRSKLLATVPNNEKGQAFVNAFATAYEKKFDADEVTEQLIPLYDKHFTDEEIKGMLQFYGSPLGQKVAAEMPKITRESQTASRAASNKAAREAFMAAKTQNPDAGPGQPAEPGQRRWQQQHKQTQQAPAQQSAQQQDPQ